MKLGRRTALISFLLGTAIVALYYLTSSSGLLFIGYWFIILAGLANVGVLISLLIRAAKANGNGKLLITCGLMLLNIPAVVVYSWVIIILLDTMRITFTNGTSGTLTDINIVGCETEYIDELEVGESRTVWVDITGDCAIAIDFLSNGTREQEVVVSYVTSSMGQKLKYDIGGGHEEVL